MGTPKVVENPVAEGESPFLDDEVAEHFHCKEMTGAEYSDGVWLEVHCRLCPATWAMHIGEYGELDKGERAAVLSHAAEHKRKGFRMRRLVR